MATADECLQALTTLAERLHASSSGSAGGLGDRRIACRIKDLDVTFAGNLRDGALVDLRESEPDTPAPDATLTMTSDDLVELVDGRLGAGTAFATGRLKVDASFRDLLRLRAMF
jgi:hypothetical protein